MIMFLLSALIVIGGFAINPILGVVLFTATFIGYMLGED